MYAAGYFPHNFWGFNVISLFDMCPQVSIKNEGKSISNKIFFQFAATDSVTDEKILEVKKKIVQLFPSIDPEKVTKASASKNKVLTTWTSKHCKSTQYSYQVLWLLADFHKII